MYKSLGTIITIPFYHCSLENHACQLPQAIILIKCTPEKPLIRFLFFISLVFPTAMLSTFNGSDSGNRSAKTTVRSTKFQDIIIVADCLTQCFGLIQTVIFNYQFARLISQVSLLTNMQHFCHMLMLLLDTLETTPKPLLTKIYII